MDKELQAYLDILTERVHSGASYVAPANRLLLQGLAISMRATAILETGYNSGLTMLGWAMTGTPRIVGVDLGCENHDMTYLGRQRLRGYPQVTLVNGDALSYLLQCPDDAFHMVFIDDCHWPAYVAWEIEEAQRIVVPGGYMIFHDVLSHGLMETIRDGVPAEWERVQVPCIQGWPGWSGNEETRDYDFGLMLVRKPPESTLRARVPETWTMPGEAQLLYEAMSMKTESTRAGMQTVLGYTSDHTLVLRDAENTDLIPHVIATLRHVRDWPIANYVLDRRLQILRMFLMAWGGYCAVLAGEREHARQDAGCFGIRHIPRL